MNNNTFISQTLLCPSCEHVATENKQDLSGFLCVSSIGQEAATRDAICAMCGQKIEVFDSTKEINLFLSAINNPNIKVVAFTAPSIRTSIGEIFGAPTGTDLTNRMVGALKQVGVDFVFDMNFAADLTTVEEAAEFTARLKSGKNLPLLTSCCPAWVNFVTRAYPDLSGNLSTCKSPQQMFGALLNTYFANKLGVNNTSLFIVSIVPCLAKKLERLRPAINSNKGFDVDCTLTTVDLGEILKMQKIDLLAVNEMAYDSEFGLSSGAGVIFGNSGGVMEAVLSNAQKGSRDFSSKNLAFDLVRGKSGLRECVVSAFGKTFKIACVSGLSNAKPLLDDVRAGKSPYAFIEVMACEGGCVGGGGQPSIDSNERSQTIAKRAEGLYARALKTNHKHASSNPAIKKLYKNFLGTPLSPTAEKILHTKF